MSHAALSDIRVRQTGKLVTLKIGGKSFDMNGPDALEVSNLVGNAAVDALDSRNGLPTLHDIHLRPFDQAGTAVLRLMTDKGPITVAVDANLLIALATAAQGALEHGVPSGSA
jgi:hypothetical protein